MVDDIEKQVNDILLRAEIARLSAELAMLKRGTARIHGKFTKDNKEILDFVSAHLSEAQALIVIELKGNDSSILHRSCTTSRAISELEMAKAMLMNNRLDVEDSSVHLDEEKED